MANDTAPPRLALWSMVAAAVALIVGTAIVSAPLPAPRFHGSVYTEVSPAADFSLVDSEGRQVTLQSYRGNPVLLFFGYTRCPDICPTTLARLTRGVAAARARDVRVLLVTVDPAHDTPSVLREYTRRFGPRVFGLTGDSAALARARAGYGAYVAAAPQKPAAGHGEHAGHAAPASAKLVHVGVVYGIDRHGNLQVVIAADATVEQVADDVRTLSRL